MANAARSRQRDDKHRVDDDEPETTVNDAYLDEDVIAIDHAPRNEGA
jgi:hypothetical protein